MKYLVIVIVATLHTCRAGVQRKQMNYKRVCYYTNWSQYRPGEGKYTPDNIDAKLCTHIIYAFAKLANNKLETLEWNDEKMYEKLQKLKQSNPDLKTLIAVGGWNAASYQFTTMVATASSRRTFIQSTLSFLQKYGFDGLDLDWEYPTKRGGKPQDKQDFAILVKELKEAFAGEGYLLTAAVPAGKSNIDDGYDAGSLAINLDFINLMSYDLHGSWDRKTGENSPLYPSSTDTGARRQLNMDWVANYWAEKGVPRNKIIIGMATYGRTFTLANHQQTAIGAPTTGPGTPGKYTREAGFMSYYEICQEMETRGTQRWDDEQKVPYYYNGKLWVGFDNVRSITEKVNWLKTKGYGGAMIWALDLDDFKQICKSSHRAYPLLSVIYDLLTSGQVKPTTKPEPSPTPVTTTSTHKPTTSSHKPTTTTSDNGKEFTCINKPDGFYPDPRSCEHFYRCVDQQAFRYKCPANLYYDPDLHLCNWQDQVDCKLDFYGY